jgi:putative heme-binding domain-containing protein
MPRLDKLDTSGLVAALDSPSGWQRDLAGQMLSWKQDRGAAPALEKLAMNSSRALARLHALCVLDGLHELSYDSVRRALADRHPGVRRHAVRLAEARLKHAPEQGADLLPLMKDSDAQVRLQLAFTLGAWRDVRAGAALASLLRTCSNDAYLSAAALSSVSADNVAAVFSEFLQDRQDRGPSRRVVGPLLAVAVALGDKKDLSRTLVNVTAPAEGRYAPWQMTALAGLLDALDRRSQALDRIADEPARRSIERLVASARKLATDATAAEAERLAALSLLGRDPAQRDADVKRLGDLLAPQTAASLQSAAVAALGRISDARVPQLLSAGWSAHTPALKGQILDLLLSRGAWQRDLLTMIESKKVPANEVDAARRQRLLNHRDKEIRTLAARVFDGAVSPDRRKVLTTYNDALTLSGDSQRGKTVFAKSCAVCHRLENVGHAVGPDLQALANKTPLYLLTEILDPNRNVDSRYLAYNAVTQAGRTFTGILAGENSTSITLRSQEGKEQVLLRTELDELQSTGKSLMPEGLEKELNKQDIADLIAYLTKSSPPPKRE